MATKTVTADELLAMPDDGFLYELIRGELSECHLRLLASDVLRLGDVVPGFECGVAELLS